MLVLGCTFQGYIRYIALKYPSPSGNPWYTHPLGVPTTTLVVYSPLGIPTPWYTHLSLGIPSPRSYLEPGIPTPCEQTYRHQWKHYLRTTLLVGSKHDPYEFVCFDAYNKQIVRYLTVYHLCNNNVSVPSDEHKLTQVFG